MREKELEYLRNELNQRLSFSYEHSHKLFGYIMLVWGGTLLLFDTKQGSFIGTVPMLFIMATIFFISVVVLYFLSQRNSENIRQLSKIAAYITIFHEKRPNDREHERIFWELATFEMDKKNMEKSQGKQNHEKMTNEYLWLSVIAIVAIVIVAIAIDLVTKKCVYTENSILINCLNGFYAESLMLWGCICYAAISLFLSSEIFGHLTLDSKEWHNTKKAQLISILDYAITDTQHYTEDEAKERFGEVFYNEIRQKK
jgi:preprotein translocase subunit SecG